MMGWEWRRPPGEIDILTKLEIPTENSALGTTEDAILNQEFSFYALDYTLFMKTVLLIQAVYTCVSDFFCFLAPFLPRL